MDYDTFIGEVQHRLELGSRGEAVRATRAVLTTLGERIGPDEAEDLAGPLPLEIDRYLTEAESGQQFPPRTFIERVADRAGIAESDAAFYARAVIALVGDVVPASEMRDIRTQLPEDFEDLFELAEAEQVPW